MNALHRRVTALEQSMSVFDSERERDILRKRRKRNMAAEVIIPDVADPWRREQCLKDPERFLRTYNPTGEKGFTSPFAIHHKKMIEAIHERAISGGDKAVAAPRGDGKTTVAEWMLIYIFLAELVRSAVLIAATRKHAERSFKYIKRQFAFNDMLCEDFPEISAPVRDLQGAPQRAAKQHVNGQNTRIVWTAEELVFPHVPDSPYGGGRLAYFGLEAAIRGGRYQFALIDDPETREVAFSDDANRKVEEIIDGDVAGLAYPDSTISRVVVTTVQNRRCYSYRVTDRKQKATFEGDRYGVLTQWPERRDMWDEYIAKRQQAQANGDKDGFEALQFYLDNREEMEAGAEITNPNRFNQRLNADGKPVEVSALQAFFNRVADWGLARAMAELQNDPEEDVIEESLGLTAGTVQNRMNGLKQNELPKEDSKITVGIDIGKFYSHWAKVAWIGNGTGLVIDYGVMETPGMESKTDAQAVMVALLTALLNWRNDILQENRPDVVLVDSGDYTDAVYEFCRRAGPMFHPSKGQPGTRSGWTGTSVEKRLYFNNCIANWNERADDHVYSYNADHWKLRVQESFITPTFDAAMQFNDGALSLFSDADSKRHLSFAHHMVAEELQEIFVEGKGLTRKWKVKSRNNHWLDAMAMASCAAGVIGVTQVPRISVQNVPEKPVKPQQPRKPNQFRSRPGGWIPKRRN